MRDNHLYKKPQSRYLTRGTTVKAKKMTVIIGFKCTHGVALVSDTKITGVTSSIDIAPSSEEDRFDSKILIPMATNPFIVGAAGYTDLFREFNNKIPAIVSEKLEQYKIDCVQYFMRIGYTRENATTHYMDLLSRGQPLPLVYSYDLFMDDCKNLIRTISEQRKKYSPNPLEVLIGVKKGANNPSLHYIDSDGLENEIPSCTAIGSGSPHVKSYFSRLYDFNKSMYELVALAFYAIAYTQKIAKETTVGYSREKPPEAFAVFNDRRCQQISITNMPQVLDELDRTVNEFDRSIRSANLSILQSSTQLPTQIITRVPHLSQGTE